MNVCLVFLGLLAIILLFGMIGDKEQKNRNNYTCGFMAVVLAMALLNIFRLF